MQLVRMRLGKFGVLPASCLDRLRVTRREDEKPRPRRGIARMPVPDGAVVDCVDAEGTGRVKNDMCV